MKKTSWLLLFLCGLLITHESFALAPTRLWFYEETMHYYCITTCYDPDTRLPVPVNFESSECQHSWWGSCTAFSCYVSCLDLLRLGYY